MTEVTHILSAIQEGEPHTAEQLLPLVYEERRKLAAQKLAEEKPGRTLQATALVHEAYLRLVDVDQVQHWNSRSHFFAAAAEMGKTSPKTDCQKSPAGTISPPARVTSAARVRML